MEQERRYSIEFKRQIIEELINGAGTPSEICRKHDIAQSVLPEWYMQYNLGRFDNSAHGISAPLAYAVSESDLRPSLPSAYIRVLRMFDSMGIGGDMTRGPFASSN